MAETLFRVFEDRASRGRCRSCEADLVWYETLNACTMPINASAVPRTSETDTATRRTILFFSSDDSHFATCPDASKYSRHAR